jgi:hypothetical protein
MIDVSSLFFLNLIFGGFMLSSCRRRSPEYRSYSRQLPHVDRSRADDDDATNSRPHILHVLAYILHTGQRCRRNPGDDKAEKLTMNAS